jgi:CTP:molybdopterin cytidylyltransferase MocA
MAGIHVLIPAAGAARRMRGADKLLETVDGLPLLRRQVGIAAAAGARFVWVALPPADRAAGAARRAALAGTGARIIEVPECDAGISAALRAGARAAAAMGASGLLVLLADLPELEAEDLARVMAQAEAAPDAVVRATDTAGRPGHPAVIPARLFPALAELSGDEGAGTLLAGQTAAIAVPLPGARATTDLDTPEAWAAWRAARTV